MRFLVQTIVTLLFGAVAQYFFPWWTVVLIAGLLGLAFYYRFVTVSFLAGFTAIALLWGGYAAFLENDRLSAQMAELIGLENPFWLVLLTGLVGGLLSGLAAAAGSSLRQIVHRKEKAPVAPVVPAA